MKVNLKPAADALEEAADALEEAARALAREAATRAELRPDEYGSDYRQAEPSFARLLKMATEFQHQALETRGRAALLRR